jgi:hypothetical protein
MSHDSDLKLKGEDFGHIEMDGKRYDLKGDAYRPNLILSRIADRIAQVSASLTTFQEVSGAAQAAAGVLMGTHATRLTTSPTTNTGALFVETDRSAVYQSQYVSNVAVWKLVTAKMPGTLSPDQKPSDLGIHDVGFEFESTDFAHIYEWSGSAWGLKVGELAPGAIVAFDANPGTGWNLADGTAGVTVSTTTGGTTTKTMPVANANNFLRGAAAYNGVVTPATVPTINNATLTQGGIATVGGATLVDTQATHNHTANLPGPPVDYIDVLYYYRL